MIDEDFKPWLIEINCSPAMDYSTEVTAELVKLVLNDCIKVIVDYNSQKKTKADTGLFSKLIKAKRPVIRGLQAFGNVNLQIDGKRMKVRVR